MGKIDEPPVYTNRPIDEKKGEEAPPPPFTEAVPHYFQDNKSPGWKIVINNRFWTDGFRIFVSNDASNKFDIFKKKNTSPEVVELQEQGFGVPLFKAVTSFISVSGRFITFRRYTPTNLHPFDVDRDYYDYCVVTKSVHLSYDTYTFKFTPDPKNPSLNFKVVLFSHSILPIHDYIYKGERRRWIDESNLMNFRLQWQVKYGFKHTVLTPDQVSMTDSWDGKGDSLDRKKQNELLNGLLRKTFSISAKYPKPEYYGPYITDVLGEAEAFFKLGYAEVKIDDTGNPNTNVNYESIFSLREDDLVTICTATVLKRQKDIVEDNRRRRRKN
ncbi:hypothetical protein SBY92_003337 [Candida maltosa Xu316]|uniref:Uncharacterized protein n=1 Tax=Candida maltosa (strain Xu316) TaxID=1245528 RepID=M3HLX1_CANMX|nr:hypothetical protein G210_0993 [Candida maltosa Xu316]